MAERQREQQKIWLILFQIKSVRARINSLAVQYFAFSTLAIIVAGAAIVLTSALLLNPLRFLFVTLLVAVATFVGVVRVTRVALRSGASEVRAAAFADDRAGLKGRLTTVLLMAGSIRGSSLWPYLVEDTYGRRHDFEPTKIQPKWLSRSIFALIAVCVAGLLLVRFARFRSGLPTLAMKDLPGAVTADLGHLDIRPADPALEPNAEIYADEATMRKLADKLASAQGGETDKRSLSQWMNKARDLAGELQNEITGNLNRHPPLRLRLTNKDSNEHESSSKGGAGPPDKKQKSRPDSAGNGRAGTASPPQAPTGQAGQLARKGPGFPGNLGSDPSQSNQNDLGSPMAGGSGSGGGASHGSGADPEHLFGPPSSQPLGSDSFRITIDAQPSDESSSPGAPAYIPPKVRVPINTRQHGDEPIARAAVPAADEMTIKRVFER